MPIKHHLLSNRRRGEWLAQNLEAPLGVHPSSATTGPVTVDQSVHPFGPQYPHLWNGDDHWTDVRMRSVKAGEARRTGRGTQHRLQMVCSCVCLERRFSRPFCRIFIPKGPFPVALSLCPLTVLRAIPSSRVPPQRCCWNLSSPLLTAFHDPPAGPRPRPAAREDLLEASYVDWPLTSLPGTGAAGPPHSLLSCEEPLRRVSGEENSGEPWLGGHGPGRSFQG